MRRNGSNKHQQCNNLNIDQTDIDISKSHLSCLKILVPSFRAPPCDRTWSCRLPKRHKRYVDDVIWCLICSSRSGQVYDNYEHIRKYTKTYKHIHLNKFCSTVIQQLIFNIFHHLPWIELISTRSIFVFVIKMDGEEE
jgi:hypothetical protein